VARVDDDHRSLESCARRHGEERPGDGEAERTHAS